MLWKICQKFAWGETADEAAFGFATTASEDELFDGEDEDDGDDFDLAEFGLADER